MGTDNAAQVIRPDPDSHFRLRPCSVCRSERGVYVGCRADGDLLWGVQCPDCGHATDKIYAARHDAQVAWNEEKPLRRLPAMVGSANGVG